MVYTEIYADANGVSHFRGVEVSFVASDFASKDNPVLRSKFQPESAGFISIPSGWNSGWHNSPGDGFAILLKGGVEIEVGSGDVKMFSPGDVWRSTDVFGRGHISRVISEEDAEVYMTDFIHSEQSR